MPTPDSKDLDPLADLDDDLGNDWESAFQSEDFMFSPDDEANDFFLFDENDAEEDIDELTSIMENAEKEVRQEEKAPQAKTLDDTQSRASGFFRHLPPPVLQLATDGLAFFNSRPLYQRALATATPVLVILLLGSFFLQQTSKEFAQTEEQNTRLTVSSEKKPKPIAELPAQKKETPPPTAIKDQPPRARTIRKQWDFPTFTIVSATPDTETLFVTVNLSLIAVLPEGGSLPEEKNVLIKDIIYQFYKNRSPTELKHFALARGEMIHKLHNWLKKEWPNSPVNTVIFSKYQVIRAPQTS